MKETNGVGDDVINSPTKQEWKVNASIVAKNTFNPIRNVMESMTWTPNPNKSAISLSLGDPTVYRNLDPAPEVVEAVRESLMKGQRNGYGPSTGFIEARQRQAPVLVQPLQAVVVTAPTRNLRGSPRIKASASVGGAPEYIRPVFNGNFDPLRYLSH